MADDDLALPTLGTLGDFIADLPAGARKGARGASPSAVDGTVPMGRRPLC
jgi:hypothetical protein